MWDLSCPDWEDRIREGRSILPDMPLNREEADLGLAMFDELRLPDVPGLPKMRTHCGPCGQHCCGHFGDCNLGCGINSSSTFGPFHGISARSYGAVLWKHGLLLADSHSHKVSFLSLWTALRGGFLSWGLLWSRSCCRLRFVACPT